METLDLFFVYGSLLTGNAARQPFRHFFHAEGEGTIGGALYHLPEGYPTLLLEDAGGRVRGEVIRLADPEAALTALDEYEGAGPELDDGGLYVRVRTEVRLDGGGDVECWVYVCPKAAEALTRARGRRVESGSWRAFLSGS